MKQIVLILFLCIVGCSFVWGQDANYYRNPDRIYLDSKDGHQGAFLWKMKKAGDVTACAEAVSKPGYKTGDWMPAIVPGTVLNSLVYNKVYPEPYYGLNNKLTSNICLLYTS